MRVAQVPSLANASASWTSSHGVRRAGPFTRAGTTCWRHGRRNWARQQACASTKGAGEILASASEFHSELGPEPGDHKQELDAAITAARLAVQEVEQFQEHIPELPSARFPTLASRLNPILGFFVRALGSAAVAVAIAAWGFSRGALDLSGAKAGFYIGWITLASSFAGGIALLSFFLASSKLTAFCEKEKQLDEAHKVGGHRNWVQVVANAAPPAALLLILDCMGPGLSGRTIATCHVAAMAYFAGCCGDTWASEIGQLSDERAYLPSGREVRPGVNGGITILGTAASGVGGLYIGLAVLLARALMPGSAWGFPAPSTSIIATLVLSTLSGLWGSFLDSVLGASLQFTGFNLNSRKVTSDYISEDIGYIAGIPLLTNSGVNLFSGLFNSLTIAAIAYAWIL